MAFMDSGLKSSFIHDIVDVGMNRCLQDIDISEWMTKKIDPNSDNPKNPLKTTIDS